MHWLSDYRPICCGRSACVDPLLFHFAGVANAGFLLIYHNLRQQRHLYLKMRSTDQQHHPRAEDAHRHRQRSHGCWELQRLDDPTAPGNTQHLPQRAQPPVHPWWTRCWKCLPLSSRDRPATWNADPRQLPRRHSPASSCFWKRAEVKFDCEGYDFTFHTDRIHLTNVIYNLIDNALKYSTKTKDTNPPPKRAGWRGGFWRCLLGHPSPEYHTASSIVLFMYRGDEHDIKGYLGLSWHVAKVVENTVTIKVRATMRAAGFTITLPGIYDH